MACTWPSGRSAETGRAVLCEGYFDVIGTVACGLEGAVAGMGTALTPEQAQAPVALRRGGGGRLRRRQRGRRTPSAAPCRCCSPRGWACGGRASRARTIRTPCAWRPGRRRCARRSWAAEDAVTAELDRLIPAGAARDPRAQAKAANDGRRAAAADSGRHPALRLRRLAANRLGIPVRDAGPAGGGRRRGQARSGRAAGPQAGPQEGPSPAPAGSPSLVRSLEEQVLDLLLQEEVRSQIPPVEELPPPGVFLDIECRNIYEAFCALYAGASRPPDFQMLKSRLGEHERTVARLAKIMLEREVASGRIGLLESLDKLTDRWRRQRIKELHGEINEAQRKGDHALRDRLVDEKTRLSRSLHRGSRQGANHGLRLSPFSS